MKKQGKRTVILENNPVILSNAAVVGPKEAEGPLGKGFDFKFEDSMMGEKTWEKAESRLQTTAVEIALSKANMNANSIDVIFAGDLLNQCIASSFGIRDLQIPFIGLYGACSTMALSLINAGVHVESNAAQRVVAVTSSHFCSAERQYRFPLEYGGVRPQTAQWTVTGSGAVLVTNEGEGPIIKGFTVGKIVDLGITDANNMGAAMAPAAADTIKSFLDDTKTIPNDYDMIFTGDLGQVGTDLLYVLLEREGIEIKGHHMDCGNMIFDAKKQDVHAGGSGCGLLGGQHLPLL